MNNEQRLVVLGQCSQIYFKNCSRTKKQEIAFSMGFLGISAATTKDKKGDLELSAWQAGQEYGMDYEILREEKTDDL